MTNILDFAKERYTLYSDQEEALENIDMFLRSNEPCFILKGYAGTGKTHLTKVLVDYFKHIHWEVDLLAPTGRASRILGSRTGQNSSTIHRGIYNLDNVSEEKTIKEGKEKYRFRFNLKSDLSNVSRAVLIDEASMVSDVENEGDFFTFGSGRLLKDILTLYATKNEKRNIRIIFIGDYAQLPPVGAPISGALSRHYLKNIHGTETSEYELTEIKRQRDDSGILTLAEYLRNQLKSTTRNSFKLPEVNGDVIKTDYAGALEHFLTSYRESREKSIVIHYKNKDAFDCNNDLREKLYDQPGVLVKDEQLIITQNNYNYDPELLNGTFVRVKNISDNPPVIRRIPSYKANGEEVQVDLKFMQIEIEVPTQNRILPLNCQILLNNLLSDEPNISYEERIALYIDFKIRHPKLKPGSTEFKDILRKDAFFNAVHVKYGYAITCHKAQGGEWEKAIVNMKVDIGKLSDAFLRWTYTAITRAGKELVMYNIPAQSPYHKLFYSSIIIENKNTMVEPAGMNHVRLTLTREEQQLIQNSKLAEAESHLLSNYFYILASLRETEVKLTNRMAMNWREDYVFEENGKKAFITWHHNSKKQFTSKQATAGKNGDPDLTNRVLQFISVPVSYSLADEEPKERTENEGTNTFHFPLEFPMLKEFYEDMRSITEPMNIRIETIEHDQYQERYTFLRNSEKVVMDFTYDSKQQVTWAQANKKKSNSQALLEDLEKAIQILKNL